MRNNLSLLSILLPADSLSGCDLGEECISIKACGPIIAQLSLAKETSDVDKKRLIISQVREKICGERQERLICCPQENQPQPSSSSTREGKQNTNNNNRIIHLAHFFFYFYFIYLFLCSQDRNIQEHFP